MPPVSRPYTRPSIIVTTVMRQLRRYQIDGLRQRQRVGHEGREADQAEHRQVIGAPGGNSRPAMYAQQKPTTSRYTNHCTRFLPIDMVPRRDVHQHHRSALVAWP